MKKSSATAAAASYSCLMPTLSCQSNRHSELEDLVRDSCRSGSLQIEDALHLPEKLLLQSEPKPSIVSFNILFTAIMRMKDASNYPTLLSLSNKLNQATGISPNDFTYSILIDCCTRMNRVDLGFSIFGAKLKRGWMADTVTLNALLTGLCTEGRVSDAVKVFDTARHSGMGCTPNVVTYNTLIIGFCAIGNTYMVSVKMVESMTALNLFGEMQKKRIQANIITYNTLLNGFCVSGRVEGVLTLINKMVGQGIAPNITTDYSLISGYCKLGKWQEALNFFY